MRTSAYTKQQLIAMAKGALCEGEKYPYDAPDPHERTGPLTPQRPEDWARHAALGVMSALCAHHYTLWRPAEFRRDMVLLLTTIIRASSDQEIEILRSRADESASRISDLTEHLRWVCVIARTWMPDYATAEERSTLELALKAVEAKP